MAVKFKEYACTLPAWALPYLINGDDTGMSAEDLEQVKTWENSWEKPITIEIVGDPYFCGCPEFGAAAEVYDCKVFMAA